MTDKIAALIKLDYCDRVRGFWYGYHFEISLSAHDYRNTEFCRGWQEGVDLLFDERRAKSK